MPTIDSNYSTLTQIRTKVRRLTRSPSVAQLTDAQIDDYINTFVLYDFPQNIKPVGLKKRLTFYTSPYVDKYGNNLVAATDPLYNFINKYVSIHPPIYIAGMQGMLLQGKEQFYTLYPKNTMSIQIGTGDGVTNAYNGTLSSHPLVPGSLSFTSISTTNGPVVLEDVQTPDPVTGQLLTTGILQTPNGVNSGMINYVTGAYTLTFPVVPDCPGLSQPIYCQCSPYQAAKPLTVLFYDNVFTFRPIPDQAYRIEMDAFIRPTELLVANAEPELAQWWQYISYGASKKVFEDRGDLESVNLIMPEYKNQELLVLRQTIMQMTNERADGMQLLSIDGDFGYKWSGN